MLCELLTVNFMYFQNIVLLFVDVYARLKCIFTTISDKSSPVIILARYFVQRFSLSEIIKSVTYYLCYARLKIYLRLFYIQSCYTYFYSHKENNTNFWWQYTQRRNYSKKNDRKASVTIKLLDSTRWCDRSFNLIQAAMWFEHSQVPYLCTRSFSCYPGMSYQWAHWILATRVLVLHVYELSDFCSSTGLFHL